MLKVTVVDPNIARVKQAVALLKDISRDLEVFADGRGTQERFYTISSTLWKVHDLIEPLNPYKKKTPNETMDAEVVDEVDERKQIVQQKAKALTHVKSTAKLF